MTDKARALLDEFWRYAALWASCGISIGFVIWGIRSKFELDVPMDNRGKRIRASVVLAGWFLASLPLPHTAVPGSIRMIALLVGYAFLWWPNLVVHITRRLGRSVAVPEAE